MIIKNLGLQDYAKILKKMQEFTNNRQKETADEIWLLEFGSVFTTGIKQKNHYIDNNKINNIPIINTDRGGNITYHGSGQIIAYLLLDLKRLKIGAKKLVTIIENSLIELLNSYNISSHKRDNMPGVYVNNAKIASVGLRIKNNKTYHGLSLNVAMDLTPFSYIDVCGYNNLNVCNMMDFNPNIKTNEVSTKLSEILNKNLSSNL